MNDEQKKIFDDWLKDRPEIIKQLVAKFPPGKYKVKVGAPYSISCTGTTVTLNTYYENGTIGVVVAASDKLTLAKAHELYLGRKHKKSAEEMEEILNSDVMVVVDPKWLELLIKL